MTMEKHDRDDRGHGPAPAPDLLRRSALAVAWSTPVIAAAVAAPGAAASTSVDGTFVGVQVLAPPDAVGRFDVVLFLNARARVGSPVVLRRQARFTITTDQDVARWSEWVVPDGPRASHIVVPPGTYPSTASYTINGVSTVVADAGVRSYVSYLQEDPPGRHRVRAAVERGPVYPGLYPSAVGRYGARFGEATVET
ncbi:hypothetical protein GTU73_12355 [Rathayibacter sp. VKM Ac-2804]|uniref:hypothetical protein n=1 Tax=unclassified Rathayibacter TaxID=2609250 RepID=UPI00132ECAC3|nr:MULTISPECIES: hypothetical protein [unclassified Rathayibacter]NRG42816.1 hypothetical protein [Rathayibacter sp. VKM Ac-2835]QHF24727.1 hypothetical protein GTU73_12355 [Rathayibacter sp. VKM Ac-2804]